MVSRPALGNSHGVGCRVRVLTTCSTRFLRTLARTQSLNSDMISAHLNVGDNILADTFPGAFFGFREPRMGGLLESKTASCALRAASGIDSAADVSPSPQLSRESC